MENNPSTLDTLIQNQHLQMIKAALPYINLSEQRFLSIYIKLLELRNTFQLYDQDPDTLSACSLQKEDGTMLDMLRDIKAFCPKEEQETIEQILNFIQVYQMYQSYQNAAEGVGPDTVEQLKGMLSPEQRSVFEPYLSNM